MKLTIINLALFIGISSTVLNVSAFDLSLNKENKNNVIKNFEAHVNLKQEGVEMRWKVEHPFDVKEYIIEKSPDKNTWVEVIAIPNPTNDHELQKYFFTDHSPSHNLSYYRLVQVFRNGTKNSSNIVPVNYIESKHSNTKINLFPGVNEKENSLVNIDFEEIKGKEILIVVRSENKNEYYSKVKVNFINDTIVAIANENEIPAGNYLIIASSENQLYSQNIVIEN